MSLVLLLSKSCMTNEFLECLCDIVVDSRCEHVRIAHDGHVARGDGGSHVPEERSNSLRESANYLYLPYLTNSGTSRVGHFSKHFPRDQRVRHPL